MSYELATAASVESLVGTPSAKVAGRYTYKAFREVICGSVNFTMNPTP